jgi:elongation factor G
MGEVHEGAATMGLDGQEQDSAAFTITVSSYHLLLGRATASISSTPPGMSNFTELRWSALYVCSTAPLRFFCAKGGVEPQSETVVASGRPVPMYPELGLCQQNGHYWCRFLQRASHLMHERLKAKAVPIQIPIGSDKVSKEC